MSQSTMSNCEEDVAGSKFKINCEMRSSSVFDTFQDTCDSWLQKMKNGELKKKLLKNVSCFFNKPKSRKKHVRVGEKHHYETIKKIYEENICNLKEADQLMKAARNIEKSCITVRDLEKKKKYKTLATELKETANRKQYNSFRDASIKLKVLEAQIGICSNNESKWVLDGANSGNNFASTKNQETCHQKDNFTQYEFKQKNTYQKKLPKKSYTIDETKMGEIIIRQHLTTCNTCREKYSPNPLDYHECDKTDTEAEQVASKQQSSNSMAANIVCPTEAPQLPSKHLSDCEYFCIQSRHQSKRNLAPSTRATQEKRNLLQEVSMPNYQGTAGSTPTSQVLPCKSQRSHITSLPGRYQIPNKEYRPANNPVLHRQSRLIPQATYKGIENFDDEHIQVLPCKYERQPLSSLLAGLNKKKKECRPANTPTYKATSLGLRSRFKLHPEPIKHTCCLKSYHDISEPFNEYFQDSPHNGHRTNISTLPGAYKKNNKYISDDKPIFEKTVKCIPQCEPIKQTNCIENSLNETTADFDDENIYYDYPPCETLSSDENFRQDSVQRLGSEREYLVRSLSHFWEYGKTDTDITPIRSVLQ